MLAPHIGTFISLGKASVGAAVTLSFLGVIFSNSTFVSLIGAILVSILTGVYIPIFLSYIGKFGVNKKGVGGLGGTLVGFLGIGCVACGSVVLTPLLSILGIGGLLTVLPFGGEEFLFLGIFILIGSIYYLLRRLNKPSVCLINPT